MRQPSAPSMAHLAWITSISRYLQHSHESRHISTRARKPCHSGALQRDDGQKTTARSFKAMLHCSMPSLMSIWDL